VLLTWDDKGVEVLPGTLIEEHLPGEHYRLAEGPAGHRRRYRDRIARRGGAGWASIPISTPHLVRSVHIQASRLLQQL